MDDTFRIPPKYDWSAQKRIEENRRALFEHSQEALPALIEGCADTRYSTTMRFDEDTTYSWSVGKICSEIIAHHVEVFRDHVRFADPAHWHKYAFIPQALHDRATDEEKEQFRDWWQRHQGKSIRDLQLEAFDWAIEKRRMELKKVLDDADPESAQHRKDAINELTKLTAARDELKKNKAGLPPRKMRAGIVSRDHLDPSYTILPWKK